MGTYAADTKVPVDRSRTEIEKTLSRYGATAFGYITAEGAAMVEFAASDRRIRFVIEVPAENDPRFARTSTGRARTADSARAAREQLHRQRWRALALVIKAKLEAVDAGILSFEESFMSNIVLPSGKTVAEEIGPQIEAAYLDDAVRRLEIAR